MYYYYRPTCRYMIYMEQLIYIYIYMMPSLTKKNWKTTSLGAGSVFVE